MSVGQGKPLPVPTYRRFSSGSYDMPSQTEPPPPIFHHSPVQVLAAASRALFSNGFEGSPGTVQNRQSSLPVLTSKAAMYPRNGGNSAPAFPMNTFPSATRGAIVIEY